MKIRQRKKHLYRMYAKQHFNTVYFDIETGLPISGIFGDVYGTISHKGGFSSDVHWSTYNQSKFNHARFRAGDLTTLSKFHIPEEQFLDNGFYYAITKSVLDKIEERGMDVERVAKATDDADLILARISGSVSDAYKHAEAVVINIMDRSFAGSVGDKIRNSSFSGAHQTFDQGTGLAIRGTLTEQGRLNMLSVDLVNTDHYMGSNFIKG